MNEMENEMQMDLFIDGLTEEDDKIKEFAIGGICNCICGINELYYLSQMISLLLFFFKTKVH